MKRNIFKYSFLASIIAVAGGCQTLPAERALTESENAVQSAFSEQGLQSIQAMMERAVDAGRIPAGLSMLAQDGVVSWIGTAGEMGPGVPMRSDAIFPLASVGKIYTATAAMILIERGLISLDDPVSHYIPEFANIAVSVENEDGTSSLVAADHPMTVFHLITHTTGLTVSGNNFWAAWNANSETTTTTHLARDLAAMPLQSHPGTQFEYGPTGAAYEVLGAVIEIVSGQNLEAFMMENIFAPLDLRDTAFYVADDKTHRLPAFYRRNDDDELVMARAYGEDFERTTFYHGGGGVGSSPEDIVRFTRIFTEGGAVDGVRILKASTVDQMMSDQLGSIAPDRWQSIGLSWGLGAAVRGGSPTSAAALPDQYGWVGGGYTKLWIDPKREIVALFFFPMDPPGDNDLLTEFDQLVYRAMGTTQP